MTANNDCHTNEDTMEDHTDPESVPEMLDRERVNDWIARLKELHQVALDQGVYLSIGLGYPGPTGPSMTFLASDGCGGLMPDLTGAREYTRGVSDKGAPYTNSRIDGCEVGTHDMRASARVTNLQGA